MLFRPNYAQDTGAGTPDLFEDDPGAQAPTRGSFLNLSDPFSDDMEDYVVDDGSLPQQEPEEEVPVEFKEKSKAQIAADFVALRASQQQQTQAPQPAFTPDMYAKSMESVLTRMPPVQQQQIQEDPEAFRKKMNDMWLEDPNKAFEMLAARQFNPILGAVADNQTAMSKEMMFLDPNTKALYGKYGEEIESVVRSIPAAERFRNPKVYQTAVETVKARHMDTILSEQVSEQVQKGVADALKAMGIEVDTNGKPLGSQQKTQYNPSAQRQAPAQVSNQQRRTVSIPREVAMEADRRGIDPKVYYRVLKESGRI